LYEAAIALGRHAAQVLGEGRSGVPQYRQPHVFLAESYVALKNLGIDMHTALLHAGGILINSLVDNMSVRTLLAMQSHVQAPTCAVIAVDVVASNTSHVSHLKCSWTHS